MFRLSTFPGASVSSVIVPPEDDEVPDISYVEFNTDVAVSAASEAAANQVVAAAAFTPNGIDSYWITFWCVGVNVAAVTGAQIRLALFDNGNPVVPGASTVALWLNPSATTSLICPGPVQRKLTPTAVAHTYSIRAWQLNGNGVVYGTVGGISVPGFIRVTKAP